MKKLSFEGHSLVSTQRPRYHIPSLHHCIFPSGHFRRCSQYWLDLVDELAEGVVVPSLSSNSELVTVPRSFLASFPGTDLVFIPHISIDYYHHRFILFLEPKTDSLEQALPSVLCGSSGRFTWSEARRATRKSFEYYYLIRVAYIKCIHPQVFSYFSCAPVQ
jgi:hypothetical protein